MSLTQISPPTNAATPLRLLTMGCVLLAAALYLLLAPHATNPRDPIHPGDPLPQATLGIRSTLTMLFICLKGPALNAADCVMQVSTEHLDCTLIVP